MKTTSITSVPEGTEFLYDGERFKVTDRSSYPIIETECVSNPEKYDGLGLVFWNFEQVQVADDAKLYQQYFEETSKHYFKMRERLI